MTAAGITTICAMRVREVMESWGYEAIAFHCNGIGAKAMEELADAEGWLEFWISPPTMSSIRFLGGSFLQVLIEWRSLAAADYLRWSFPEGPIYLFGSLESVSPKMLERKHVIHNPIHTHVKANHDEMVAVGRFVAERLSRSSGPSEILIPDRGSSQLNIAGGPMFEPESDKGFLTGLSGDWCDGCEKYRCRGAGHAHQ